MRIKLPVGKGVGCAAWLYSITVPVYNEIDIFETFGVDRTPPFPSLARIDAVMQTYIRTRPGINSGNKAYNWVDALKVNLSSQNSNTPFNLNAQYVIYGIEVLDGYVNWYINGYKTRSYAMADVPACFLEWIMNDNWDNISGLPKKRCVYSGFPAVNQPMTLRLGTDYGCIGDCNEENNRLTDNTDLPVYMDIDYVRAWVKQGKKACTMTINTPTGAVNAICATNWGAFKATMSHYPDAVFTWSSTGFDIDATSTGNFNSSVWCTLKPNVARNVSYPITCTVTFPSDGVNPAYTETVTQHIFVCGSPPVMNGYVPTKRLQGNFYVLSLSNQTPLPAGTTMTCSVAVGSDLPFNETTNVTVCLENACGKVCQTTPVRVGSRPGGSWGPVRLAPKPAEADNTQDSTTITTSRTAPIIPTPAATPQIPTLREHFARVQRDAEAAQTFSVFPNPTSQ